MTRKLRDLPRSWPWLLGAVAVWCLMWGEVEVKTVLGGLVVALLVMVLFPMPPMGHELTLRPLRFVTFLGRFLVDLVVSAVQVAWFAIRPAGQPPSSVIAVTLASRSDFFLTMTAVLATLIPGSVVVEAQRATGTLFLHVIGAGTEEQAEAQREATRAQERRLLLALARQDVLEEAGLR